MGINKNKVTKCIGLAFMILSIATLITAYISYIDVYSHDFLLFTAGFILCLGIGLTTGEVKITK